MMWVLLGTVFCASLLGSLHCVGMCGPFALLASAGQERRKSAIAPAIAYSFGRLTTYSVVGVLFGSLGMAINGGTSVFGKLPLETVQQTATLIAGGLMVGIGLVALARQLGWRLAMPGIGFGLQRTLRKFFQQIKRQPRLRQAFLIGAITCLMPCGWLYTFAIVAAGTGGPVWGAAVMIAFWAGTVPIMLALVMGFGHLGHAVQRKLPIAMALTVIVIGCFTMSFRSRVAIGGDVQVVSETELLIDQIQSVDHAELPCCRKN